MVTDPYRMLGIAPGASEAEIRAAWRAASKRLHPDVGGSAEEFRLAHDAYRQLLGSRTSRQDEWRSATDLSWDVDIWLVEPAYDRWAYSPARSALIPLAIAMALMVMVAVLLSPAVIALSP